jgi:hypothetical protein
MHPSLVSELSQTQSVSARVTRMPWLSVVSNGRSRRLSKVSRFWPWSNCVMARSMACCMSSVRCTLRIEPNSRGARHCHMATASAISSGAKTGVPVRSAMESTTSRSASGGATPLFIVASAAFRSWRRSTAAAAAAPLAAVSPLARPVASSSICRIDSRTAALAASCRRMRSVRLRKYPSWPLMALRLWQTGPQRILSRSSAQRRLHTLGYHTAMAALSSVSSSVVEPSASAWLITHSTSTSVGAIPSFSVVSSSPTSFSPSTPSPSVSKSLKCFCTNSSSCCRYLHIMIAVFSSSRSISPSVSPISPCDITHRTSSALTAAPPLTSDISELSSSVSSTPSSFRS